jgi:hypothetical protein
MHRADVTCQAKNTLHKAMSRGSESTILRGYCHNKNVSKTLLGDALDLKYDFGQAEA